MALTWESIKSFEISRTQDYAQNCINDIVHGLISPVIPHTMALMKSRGSKLCSWYVVNMECRTKIVSGASAVSGGGVFGCGSGVCGGGSSSLSISMSSGAE